MDTGIGIERDQLARVFEEFTQLDSTTTRRHAGTGLGLAISRHLAILLGGSLEAGSVPGTGSTFTVTVPLRHPSAPAAMIPPRAERPAA